MDGQMDELTRSNMPLKLLSRWGHKTTSFVICKLHSKDYNFRLTFTILLENSADNKLMTRGPWWSYIAHLSKQLCKLTVEVSAKFTALRFLYKFYSPTPERLCFFHASWLLELNLERRSPKEQFCQVLLKLVMWFLTKRFLKCFI